MKFDCCYILYYIAVANFHWNDEESIKFFHKHIIIEKLWSN